MLAAVRCKWTVGLTQREEEEKEVEKDVAEEAAGKELRFQLEGT